MCRNKHTRKFINAKTSIMDPRGIYVLKIADRASKPSPNNRNGVIRCNSKHYMHETGCIEELELDSVHPLYVWKGKMAIYHHLFFCRILSRLHHWYGVKSSDVARNKHLELSINNSLLDAVNPLSSLPSISSSTHLINTTFFLLLA